MGGRILLHQELCIYIYNVIFLTAAAKIFSKFVHQNLRVPVQCHPPPRNKALCQGISEGSCLLPVP